MLLPAGTLSPRAARCASGTPEDAQVFPRRCKFLDPFFPLGDSAVRSRMKISAAGLPQRSIRLVPRIIRKLLEALVLVRSSEERQPARHGPQRSPKQRQTLTCCHMLINWEPRGAGGLGALGAWGPGGQCPGRTCARPR